MKIRPLGDRVLVEPVEEKEKKAEENPIVTDPLMDSPHEVKITVSTYVFQNSEGEVKK